jgi:hypothetical protein
VDENLPAVGERLGDGVEGGREAKAEDDEPVGVTADEADLEDVAGEVDHGRHGDRRHHQEEDREHRREDRARAKAGKQGQTLGHQGSETDDEKMHLRDDTVGARIWPWEPPL